MRKPYRIKTNLRPNYCAIEGAKALKAKIEAKWRERGLPEPDVKLQPTNCGIMNEPRVDIRSDLLNGYPREIALQKSGRA